MRLFGNFGTLRVGATCGIEFFWNRQWTVNYKAANVTLTKTVNLSREDLSAFYVNGKCESGSLVLKISQDGAEKEIIFPGNVNETVDMSVFNAGLIKLVLTAESAKNMKTLIGWRRQEERDEIKL